MSEDPPISREEATHPVDTADVIGVSMLNGVTAHPSAENIGESEASISLRQWEDLIHTDPERARELMSQVFPLESLPYAETLVNALAAEATDFTTLPTYKIMRNRLGHLFGLRGQAPLESQIVLPKIPYEPIFGINTSEQPLPPLERITPEERQAQVNRNEEGVLTGPTSMAALFIDLSQFKRLNDERGHAIGDMALTAVGERLGKAFRYMGDTLGRSSSDIVAHRSGDEFVVSILGVEKLTAEALVMRVADHLKEVAVEVGTPENSSEVDVVTRGSVAGAYASNVNSYGEAMALIKAADDTLNEQKRPERAADPRA